MDEQQTRATRTASSDEEEETDERRRRKQRGHEDSHNQPNVQRKAPQATQEDDGSATPEDIEPHEMARIQAVSSGGVTVNESVCVRKNPTRGARPQREAEAKKPVRKKATKGPIFKGTYLQRMGAAVLRPYPQVLPEDAFAPPPRDSPCYARARPERLTHTLNCTPHFKGG